jgi:transcriptional regulator with XRE-family HTH domain
MIRNPKSWRELAGLTLEAVARTAGIKGKNPAATYRRYETGQNRCPEDVIEKIREMSSGLIGPEEWHAVRAAWLKARPGVGHAALATHGESA